METGIALPDFKKIEPLTESQSANILGGEACMWSEMVDDLTSESRIFPRAAVVAEKLWSPKAVTTNTKDMYRRLTNFDEHLEAKGIRHNAYRSFILRDIIAPEGYKALMDLVQVLAEDILFNRMVIYEHQMSVNNPLNRIVDAAPAESLEAYWFGQDVANWLEHNDSSAKKRIDKKLSNWASLNERLMPYISNDERLEAIAPHISNISELSKLAIQALGQTDAAKPDQAVLEALFQGSQIAYGATLLAVAEDLKSLILGKLEEEND